MPLETPPLMAKPGVPVCFLRMRQECCNDTVPDIPIYSDMGVVGVKVCVCVCGCMTCVRECECVVCAHNAGIFI